MRKIKPITICTSASFYKPAWEIKEQLEKRGFKIIMPYTSTVMNRTGNWKISHYKIWYKDTKKFERKAWLMRRHFNEVAKADAILVINLRKKGIEGYIGGNVLMEMALAFYLGKLIFLWNPQARNHPYYEEILGVQPVVLKRNLNKLPLVS